MKLLAQALRVAAAIFVTLHLQFGVAALQPGYLIPESLVKDLLGIQHNRGVGDWGYAEHRFDEGKACGALLFEARAVVDDK
jgi:hypothetical protein